MTYVINGRVFEVKQTNGRFFYFSPLTGRWLPVAKSSVTFIAAESATIN